MAEEMKKILFICIHNSARSQIAEAFINNLAADRFRAESAGLEPGELNLIVVKAMLEMNIDISKNKTKSVSVFLKEGKAFDYVITVCDAASGEQCPVFPGKGTKRLHWEFPDPSSIKGTAEEKLAGVRVIRDQVKVKIEEFLKEEK